MSASVSLLSMLPGSQVCQRVVEHLAGADHRYRISRMVLYMKEDRYVCLKWPKGRLGGGRNLLISNVCACFMCV